MTLFSKVNSYFPLNYKNHLYFAYQSAKTKKSERLFIDQLNNIRVVPLNLSKNIRISNILTNKTSKSLIVTNKNIFEHNYITLYLLKTISKNKNLLSTLCDYFYFSNQTLNVLWGFYLGNKINIKLKEELTAHYFNAFIFNKISEICYYQYNVAILNSKKLQNTLVLTLATTNFWLNNSTEMLFYQKLNYKKATYNYLLNKNINLKKIIYTKSCISNFLTLNATNNILVKNENVNNWFLYKPFKNYLKIPSNYLYALIRLEEKIAELKLIENNTIALQKLTFLYNFLINTSNNKTRETLTADYILGNIDLLTKAKNLNLSVFINKIANKKTNSLNFYNQIKNRFSLKNRQASYFTGGKIKKFTQNLRITSGKNFVNKKLELKHSYTKAIYNKNILKTILHKNTKIFYINALSLTKFGYLLEKKSASNQNFSVNPNKFLANLDREMISKYKYVGVYIKDLIRVAFIALFLKKPAFLAKFIAFQLNVLPKNRKETNFIRFIIKLVKTFAAEREEIWGLRLKFKGRVNRWRRTKVILGQRGILPLHTMNNRIEYGSAQGINRKGALGVHIWIWYNPIFKKLLKNTYQKYFIYSKYLTSQKKIND